MPPEVAVTPPDAGAVPQPSGIIAPTLLQALFPALSLFFFFFVSLHAFDLFSFILRRAGTTTGSSFRPRLLCLP